MISLDKTNKTENTFKTQLHSAHSKRAILIFLIIISFIFSFENIAKAQNNKKFIVVIDPGHGGSDPGSSGKLAKEKDVALAISLKTGNYIKKNIKDVEVLYTRKKDVYPNLWERTAFANQNKADLFISIHADAVNNKSVYGTSTFALGLHKSQANFDVARRENSVITLEEGYKEKYENFDPNAPESYIMFELCQNIHLDQSLNLASKIQEQFTNRVHRKNRGVKQAGFLVLWNTTMPSVLIETGFLTNVDEEKFLVSEQGQDLIASAIFRAFREYKNELDEKKPSIKNTKSEVKDIVKIEVEKKPKNTSNNIWFEVQILSSSKKIAIDSPKFKGLENITERKINNSYKYFVGKETDYDSIIKFQKYVRNSISDAFTVAFDNGEKITVRQALKKIKK